MALFLFFLFIAVPIIEIALMIQVGTVLGVLPTVLLMVITAVLGASLVKSQGIQMVWSIKERIEQGQLPDLQIAEGILLAIAGILLITPGFITDTLGLTFLMPVSRVWIAQRLMHYVKIRVLNQGASSRQEPFNQDPFNQDPFNQDPSSKHSKGKTIDAEFTRKDD